MLNPIICPHDSRQLKNYGKTSSPTTSPTVSPTTSHSPTTSTDFSYVGGGYCLDSNGDYYDNFWIDHNGDLADDVTAAAEWCQSATAFTSQLVGVSIIEGTHWYCFYDDGIVGNGLSANDFDPAPSGSYYGWVGSGVVSSVESISGRGCWRNDVSLNT